MPYAHYRQFLWVVFLNYFVQNSWSVLLLWRVLEKTHSAVWMAFALMLGTISDVFVGLLGPQRGGGQSIASIMLFQTVIMGVGVILAPSSLVGLLVIALINGWLSGRVVPLLQAHLMRHTPVDHLRHASRGYELASRFGILLGPLAAGWGLANLSFSQLILTVCVVLAIAFLLIRPLSTAWIGLPRPVHQTQSFQPFFLAVRQITHDSFLGLALAIRGLNNLLWPAFTLGIPLLVLKQWHHGSLGYGVIRSTWGLSTIIGAVWLLPRIRASLKKFYFVSWMMTGTGFALLALSPSYYWALGAAMIGAIASPAVHVALDTHIGEHIPASDQGHVFAVQQFVMSGLGVMGLGIMAALYKVFHPQTVLILTGMVMISAAVVGFLYYSRHIAGNQAKMSV
ncbi:MFS transporter [Sulfobacillus thermosulfidooxidans]|uniref:MFS transporter n=1 Tax=Sulfobacillus thermosulfidooxidans TaxID=28034 RepID=UPI0006B66B7E|nr:MFS transporter [Sulfobacillus thermosulfidooxidans]